MSRGHYHGIRTGQANKTRRKHENVERHQKVKPGVTLGQHTEQRNGVPSFNTVGESSLPVDWSRVSQRARVLWCVGGLGVT